MIPLPTGAEMRITGATDALGVVCVNGGQAGEAPGTWSATLEWLVAHVAPRFPAIVFAEVRYRVKSWRRLDWGEDDTRAAIAAGGALRTVIVGFSMGGAVAGGSADAPGVDGVLGLAPWLPDRLDLSRLRGRRLDVLHGQFDRALPGVPGVSAASSRRGFERARSLGVEGTYGVIPGAVHGIAVRAGRGVVPLPRARRWASLAADRISTWADAA